MARIFFVAQRIHSSLVAVALSIGLFLAGSATALEINVTGVPGSGTSVWTFSGSTTGWALPASAQVDGAFSLTSGLLHGRLNNFQLNNFNSGPFGSFSEVGVALGSGATATGSTSGVHALEGFTFQSVPRFAWFADGAFPGSETMTFSGAASAPFEINLIDGIVNPGDLATVTANSFVLGSLTMNFVAIPEPSTALLMGLGLVGLRAAGRRT